jgi:hypothetical protein
VTNRVRRVSPRFCQAWKLIFSAISTAAEPLSAKNTLAQTGRRHAQQFLGQADSRFVSEARQHHVFELLRLRRDGRGDARFGMAEEIGPPARHRVQIPFPGKIFQPRPAPAPDRHQRQRFRVFAHLGTGMPEHGEVARAPFLVHVGGWIHGFANIPALTCRKNRK